MFGVVFPGTWIVPSDSIQSQKTLSQGSALIAIPPVYAVAVVVVHSLQRPLSIHFGSNQAKGILV